MGLWTGIKEAVVSWKNDPLFINKAKKVGNYVYKVLQGIFQIISRSPDVVYTLATDPPMRTIAKHVGYISVYDVLLTGALSSAWYLAESLSQEYLLDEESADAIKATGLLLLSGFFVAKSITNIRNTIQHSVHSAVLTLEFNEQLNKLNTNRFDVCSSDFEQCTVKRYAQGAIRSTITFYMTEALLRQGDNLITEALSIYHHGNYIMRTLLPGLCDRHQVEYLKEHSELVLSIGLVHFFVKKMMTTTLEESTGVPAVFYQAFFSEIALFLVAIAGMSMPLPAAVKESKRTIVDPVLFFQTTMGFLVDTFLAGLKVKFPQMMAQRTSETLWADILGEVIIQGSKLCTQPVKHVILPTMMQSSRQFLSDSVNHSYLERHRENIVFVLNALVSICNHPVVAGLLAIADSSDKAREATAIAVRVKFNVPPEIVILLVKLVHNKAFMEAVQDFRRTLEALHPINVSTLESVFNHCDNSLRGDDPITAPNDSPHDESSVDSSALNQDVELFKKHSTSSFMTEDHLVQLFNRPKQEKDNAESILKGPKKPKKQDDGLLIRSSSRFFKEESVSSAIFAQNSYPRAGGELS